MTSTQALSATSMRLQATKSLMIAAVALVCAAAIMLTSLASSPRLVVKNQESGEIYYETDAVDGTRITLQWIHSVEHEPWIEIYEVRGSEIVLQEIILEGYGAGIPSDPGGTTTNENGVIHTVGINRPEPYLRWVHSHRTHHELTVGDHHIGIFDIEHHAFVELSVED